MNAGSERKNGCWSLGQRKGKRKVVGKEAETKNNGLLTDEKKRGKRNGEGRMLRESKKLCGGVVPGGCGPPSGVLSGQCTLIILSQSRPISLKHEKLLRQLLISPNQLKLKTPVVN